jgi:hypothetical protein
MEWHIRREVAADYSKLLRVLFFHEAVLVVSLSLFFALVFQRIWILDLKHSESGSRHRNYTCAKCVKS